MVLRQGPLPRRQHPGGVPARRVPAVGLRWGARLGARHHRRPPPTPCPRCTAAAAGGLPTLADPGYDGAGIGIHIPVKQPPRQPGTRYRYPHPQRHPALTALPRRTRVRPAHRPLAHPPAHHRQPQQDRRHRPRRPRPHPFRARLHHMKIAEITSLNRLLSSVPPGRTPANRECADWPLPAASHRTAHSGIRRIPDRNAEQLTERNQTGL